MQSYIYKELNKKIFTSLQCTLPRDASRVTIYQKLMGHWIVLFEWCSEGIMGHWIAFLIYP
jgi:hypothetical protein